MKINCYEGDCGDSRYFYLNKGKDISLQGNVKGNHYTFYTSNYENDKEVVHEKFELVKDGNDFSGTWTNNGGKPLTVKLSVIDIKHVKNKFDQYPAVQNLKDDNPYDYLRSSGLNFIQDSVVKYKDKEIDWFHETHSDVPFFSLGNGFSKDVKDRINPMLEDKRITEALNSLGCAGRWGDGEIDYTITVGYLDENLLGFYVFTNYDCGGAHPDFGGEGTLLDLHNGNSYELDDIIAFDKSVTSEKQSGFDTFSAYRTNFFAPQLMALQKTINKIDTYRKEDECDYMNTDIWTFPSWNFTEKGIEFTPSFARVARACEEPFLIPFSKLAAYKNAKFPYKFPVK